MRKSFVAFLVVVLLVSILVTPNHVASAQVVASPATINKTFSPDTIPAGGTSVLRIFFFNPNGTALTNASVDDNMPAGIRVVNVVGNTCQMNVDAAPGSSTIRMTGGTIPAQSGPNPGSCVVTVNVTAPNAGTFANTIPAGTLTSIGPGGQNVSNISDASITLLVLPAGQPSVSKSFSPSSIWAGQTSQLTVLITNGANTTLTGATLYDDLPAGVSLANPVGAILSGCGASASVDGTSGGQRFTLNNGTIPPGTTCSITVNVTGNVQGSYNNQIPAGRLGNNQQLTNPTEAAARLVVRDVNLTKRFSPPTFPAGGTTTLTITLQNPKSTPYTGVEFTDNLPAPLTAVSVSANSCNGSVSIAPPTTVSLSGGTIPGGSVATPGTCTVSVVVTAPAGTASGQLRNTIRVDQFRTNEVTGLATPANANVQISGSDVAGIKSFSPSTIPSGGNSRLRIDIFGPSDTGLTNLRIQDDLPAGVTISNSTAAAVTNCGASAVLTANTGTQFILLENGAIAAGQSQPCRIDVYVTSSAPTAPGTFHTNTIPPRNITNNEGRAPANDLTANLAVTGAGALSIGVNKNFNPPSVFLGAASTLSITLTNPSTVTFTGINFEDRMPPDMILADPVNFNVGGCGGTLTGTPGSNVFTFSGGTLLPGSSCTLTLSATISINGNLINIIPPGSVKTDNPLVTNDSEIRATLSNLPGAAVTKSFAPNPITVGNYSLLTITVENTGNIPLTQMTVTDTLPAGLVIASAPAPAPVNNCGGTFTAVSGTQDIRLENGVLAGLTSCTMVVAVTGSDPGDYLNTIPAGGLQADPNIRNPLPATATLTITDGTTPPTTGGGDGGGGRGRGNTTPATPGTSAFLVPVTGFAPGMVTKLDASARPLYDATSLTVEIPVIGVSAPIVGVPSQNGKWDVSWLQDQVGWLEGTAYPTWKGNSVITGHVVNADGKLSVFSKLKHLGIGEYIFVYQSGYRYTYKVVSNGLMQPNDVTVTKHEEKPFLTLITCDLYDEKTGTYLKRVAVRAVLVDVSLVK